MPQTQVSIYIRYYKLDENKKRTGEMLYEGSYTGPPLVIRKTLEQLKTQFPNDEADITIRSTELPTSINQWWAHLITETSE